MDSQDDAFCLFVIVEGQNLSAMSDRHETCSWFVSIVAEVEDYTFLQPLGESLGTKIFDFRGGFETNLAARTYSSSERVSRYPRLYD